jgi:hypothetical protein
MGAILIFVAVVGTGCEFQYTGVSIQGNCTCKEVVDIVNISLLGIKVLTTIGFVLYQSFLLCGSYIASTACQTASESPEMPQFNEELPVLRHINVILLIDQFLLLISVYTTTGEFWSCTACIFLFSYYLIVLVVINKVRSRLKKAICPPSDENGYEEQEDLLEAVLACLLSLFHSFVSLLPDQYKWHCLALHIMLAAVVKYAYVQFFVIFLNLFISYFSLVLVQEMWGAFMRRLVVVCFTGLRDLKEIMFSADVMHNCLLNGTRHGLGFVFNCSNVIFCTFGLLSFGSVVYLFFAISACNGEDSVLCWISSACVVATNVMVVVREVHLLVVMLREKVNGNVSHTDYDTHVSFVKRTCWYHVALSLTMFLWVYKCPVSSWAMWLCIILPCQLLLPGIVWSASNMATLWETPLVNPSEEREKQE